VSGTLVSPLGSGPFSSPLLGRFNLMNQLQAVGALLQQGLPLPGLLAGLESFRGVPGRMERVLVASQQHAAGGVGRLRPHARWP
jgi:UDP-N-acetylmuramoyl-L-alanyl-D-glutamate--2,6-diaminopimelate ligase